MAWLLYLAASPAALIMFLRLISLVLPSGPAQLVSFAAFTLTAFILLLASASYGMFASIVLRIVGYGGLSQWTVGRSFKWSMWITTGVTFRVTGSMKREGGMTGEDALNMRPAVFVGNHQTEMDVLMLGCIFPKYTSVTAKSSLKWTPFLGWFSKSRELDTMWETRLTVQQWLSPKLSSSTVPTAPSPALPSTLPPRQ
jgi:lysophosphatidate acyltransferase